MSNIFILISQSTEDFQIDIYVSDGLKAPQIYFHCYIRVPKDTSLLLLTLSFVGVVGHLSE